MKLKEILDKTIKFFQDKGFETPRLDAELLIAHALKVERIQLYLKFDQPVSEAEVNVCRERAAGEPVAYIVGEKGFFNHVFKVGPGVLIPRPETEHVVEEAVEWANKNSFDNYTILDLGCGSGCIGLSILKQIPNARLFAVDISEKALSYTKENAETLGVGDRVTLIQANADDAAKVMSEIRKTGNQKIQIIVSNPPYIDEKDTEVEANVKAYEPAEALFAGKEGFEKLQKWSRDYLEILSEPGLMLMEMGYQQGPQMQKHFETLSFDTVGIKKDYSGHDRVIKGEIYG
jgi:release factor glutamine methyltransferase